MSYIAFDLDALNRAPAAARAAGVREEDIIAGLVRLWAWCFREKVARVDADQVRGHFGADVSRALTAFGFLEPDPAGGWRVKGADRYLRIADGRSKGGKAASGNLIPGGPKRPPKSGAPAEVQPRGDAETQPSVSRASAENKPRLDLGLSPTTDDLAPTTESKSIAPAPRSPRDSDLLCADFLAVTGSPYGWNGAKDGAALAWLVKQAPLEEVRARWRRGLAASGWLLVRNVAQLRAKWNDLAPGNTGPRVVRNADFTDSISETF